MAVKKRYIYEPYGYQEGENYSSIRNTIDDEINTNRQVDESQEQSIKDLNKRAFTSSSFDKDRQVIQFKNYSGDIRSELNMSEIISAILPNTLIADARYDSETKNLVIDFENGESVSIPFGDLIDENEFGDGLTVDGGVVSVKIDEESEDYLTVSEDGIKLSGVKEAIEQAVKEEFERAEKEEIDVNELLKQEVKRLDDLIDAEKDRAEGIENGLREDLTEESERAESEEIRIETKLNSEIERSIAKDDELEQAIADEEARAIDAENALDDKIEAETARATEAEETIDTKLDDEIERAESEEARIEANLDKEIDDARAAEQALDDKFTKLLQDEEDARQTQDNALNTAISTLKSDSDAADSLIRTELSEKFTGLDNKIDRETYDREQAVANEQSRAEAVEDALNVKANEIESNLNDEIARSTSEDATLAASISTEETRAMDAESVLADKISDEETRAKAAEDVLETKIDDAIADEAVAREQADDALSSSIETEIADRLERERDFFDGVDYDKDAHKIDFLNGTTVLATVDTSDFIKDGMVESVELNGTELVITFNTDAGKDVINIDVTNIFNPENYYNKSDIDDLVDGLSNDITTEKNRAEAAENALDALISDEVDRAKARENEIDTSLKKAISDEETRAKAEEKSLGEKIQKEVDDRQDAISTLKSDSDTADALLEQKILAEKTERELNEVASAKLDADNVNASFYNSFGTKLYTLDLNDLVVDGGEY